MAASNLASQQARTRLNRCLAGHPTNLVILYFKDRARAASVRVLHFIRAVPCNNLRLPVRVKSQLYTLSSTMDKSESIMIRTRQKWRPASSIAVSNPLLPSMYPNRPSNHPNDSLNQPPRPTPPVGIEAKRVESSG